MIIFLGNSHSLSLYDEDIKKSKDDRDIVVSCQYPHRVPKSLLKSHTCINIHYGILPEFAGCNPIYWQIMKGDIAGITIHYMDAKLDIGNIITIRTTDIETKTADELYEELSQMGLEAFREIYESVIKKQTYGNPQDVTKRNYYKKSDVDFSKKLCTSNNEIRALHFKGKQYPRLLIEGREYELHSV